MNMFQFLHNEHQLRKQSLVKTSATWEKNRKRVLEKHKEDDDKILEQMFKYLVKLAIYEHFENPENIWAFSSKIEIKLPTLIFRFVQKQKLSLFDDSLKFRIYNLIYDFLDIPIDVREFDDSKTIMQISLNLSNDYGSCCWVNLIIYQDRLALLLKKRKSAILIQNWIRKLYWEPKTGIMYKKVAATAVEKGFLP